VIWLDIETTGLDPVNDKILELAMFNDETGYVFERVFYHDGEGLPPFILDMHTKNGLLSECARSEVLPCEIEANAVAWLPGYAEEHEGVDKDVQLAGSSVHFDLSFLRVHMPILAGAFSHRLFDVSAIKLFCERLGMRPISKANAHRALDDIAESRNHLAVCDGWIRAGRS
jgi:oligoribonuclease